MKEAALKHLLSIIALLVIMFCLTSLAYPILVNLSAMVLFDKQRHGLIVKDNERVIGSMLLAQNFESARYFWPRPSATTPAYNSERSSGSNYAIDNPVYIKILQDRLQKNRALNPNAPQAVPLDLLTASASGLDPDISLDAALYQAPRVAAARNLSKDKVIELIETKIKTNIFSQDKMIRVLDLNLALDALNE